MASVKNVKSKGRADCPEYTYYYYRRYAYRQEPPAKLCRPLRYIKRWAQEAADELYKNITALSRQGLPFDAIYEKVALELSEHQYRSNYLRWTQRCANRGLGHHVQRMAYPLA